MKSPAELSFLPEDYLAGKSRRRANVLCGVLAAVVMGAVGAAFTLTERSMAHVESRHSEIDKLYTDAAKRIEQVKQMRQRQERIVKQAELASSLVEKAPRSNLLADFTNRLPAGVSLIDLLLESRLITAPPPTANVFEQRRVEREAKAAGKPGDLPPAEAKHYDVMLKLTGVADDDVQVAQFIAKLNQSTFLRDVNLVISDSFKQDERTLRRFQIEMALNPNAEAADEKMATSSVTPIN